MSRLTRYLRAVLRQVFDNPRKRGAAWPPGTMNILDTGARRGQDYLLKLASLHGPIFRLWLHGQHTTCVVGHARGGRLLREGQSNMTSVTFDQTSLYPKGNIRMLQGDEHRHYRRHMMAAVNAAPVSTFDPPAEVVIDARLGALARAHPHQAVPSLSLRRALHQAATDCMILAATGLPPQSDAAVRLSAAYDRFGFEAPSNRIGEAQREAFAEIRAILAQGGHDRSFLGYLATAGVLDEVLVGNIVYTIETTRFDLSSLWRWIVYYLAAAGPAFIDKARDAPDSDLDAIVHETLRLNQSEYLLRRVSRSFVFEGNLIPADSLVRVCTWEGHKDPVTFPRPFEFRPERFVGTSYPVDQYAPFGLDKHRCLGAGLTVDLSRAFLRTLLAGYDFEGVDVGVPERGKHHWEPNAGFTLRLQPREPARLGQPVE